MAKKLRMKTATELAAPKFKNRIATQSQVLTKSFAEGKKLSLERYQYVLDVAADD